MATGITAMEESKVNITIIQSAKAVHLARIFSNVVL